MSKELREILSPLFNENADFIIKDGNCHICGFPFSKEYRSKCIDQAEQAILALMDKRFEECLPKKMTRGGMAMPYAYLQKLEGWNLCIDEIRARWEGLK